MVPRNSWHNSPPNEYLKSSHLTASPNSLPDSNTSPCERATHLLPHGRVRAGADVGVHPGNRKVPTRAYILHFVGPLIPDAYIYNLTAFFFMFKEASAQAKSGAIRRGYKLAGNSTMARATIK